VQASGLVLHVIKYQGVYHYHMQSEAFLLSIQTCSLIELEQLGIGGQG